MRLVENVTEMLRFKVHFTKCLEIGKNQKSRQ